MPAETAFHTAGLILYTLAALIAVGGALRGRPLLGAALVVVAIALATQGTGILIRWVRLDHGPYLNMFEALSSNVWSLHAGLLLALLALPKLRPVMLTALPALQVLVLWLLTVPAKDAPFPGIYDTVWLPVHVWLGKIFLAVAMVAVAASLVVLVRLVRPGGFRTLPASPVLEDLCFRLVLLAFVFECLMLVAGAAWAQDAWGRYWAWDPLETWSFLTWLAVAGFLHFRITFNPRPVWSALMVAAIFIIAFATFFGMPFISTAPHKGML